MQIYIFKDREQYDLDLLESGYYSTFVSKDVNLNL